jgi:cis-3-alkyl-4-acyloxetan-2-one decarboxylase
MPTLPSPEQATLLSIDGTEVLVEGGGPQAPVLLMIHGWPDTRALWDAQVAHFSRRFRCARFTLPGFDPEMRTPPLALDGMVARIAAVADAVSPAAPVQLMLHDWGCFFGYQFAMRHPARVGRVIGVDVGDTTSPAFRRSQSLKDKLLMASYQLWLAFAHALPETLGNGMTRGLAHLMHAPHAQLATARMNHPYAALWSGRYRRAQPLQLNGPVLYVYGLRKPAMFHSPAWLDQLAATPGCAVHGLPTGHWVMVEQPAMFHRLVDAWLAGEAVSAQGADEGRRAASAHRATAAAGRGSG